jgi:hypothetical protein
MKTLLVMLVLLVLVGCAPHAMRTGAICIPPIATDDFGTSDPVEIKQDVVDQIEPNLRRAIIERIHSDTSLKVDKKCGPTDYILNLKFDRVDAMTSGRIARTVLGTFTASNRFFQLSVSGTLDKPGDSKHVAIINEKSDMKPLDESVADVAEDIADSIHDVKAN